MHELAIVESVVDAITTRLPEARIAAVRLEIGQLSGVVPDAVRFCFELATEGTALQGATLDIVEVPALGRCRSCRAEFGPQDMIMLCPCGSADVEAIAGFELRIVSVEVGQHV